MLPLSGKTIKLYVTIFQVNDIVMCYHFSESVYSMWQIRRCTGRQLQQSWNRVHFHPWKQGRSFDRLRLWNRNTAILCHKYSGTVGNTWPDCSRITWLYTSHNTRQAQWPRLYHSRDNGGRRGGKIQWQVWKGHHNRLSVSVWVQRRSHPWCDQYVFKRRGPQSSDDTCDVRNTSYTHFPLRVLFRTRPEDVSFSKESRSCE